LQSDIARFNFQQQAPQQNLATFLSSVYGNPMATLKSQTQTGSADTSNLQNLLGIAAVGGGLYKNLGGASGISNLTSGISNWLAPSAYDSAANYASTADLGWLGF
jgi:hypothetical protein